MYTCSRTEPPSQFGRMGKRTAHEFNFPKIQQVLEQKLKLLNHNLHRSVEIELQAEMLILTNTLSGNAGAGTPTSYAPPLTSHITTICMKEWARALA